VLGVTLGPADGEADGATLGADVTLGRADGDADATVDGWAVTDGEGVAPPPQAAKARLVAAKATRPARFRTQVRLRPPSTRSVFVHTI
jgi:hypothetical protein